MKKLMSLLLVLAVCFCGAALAENAGDRGDALAGTLTGGGYEVRIPCTQEEANSWVAEEPGEENGIVSLASAAWEDGAFIARYAPVGDGEQTVRILRCDDLLAAKEVYTFDILVKDGAIQEAAGGSYAAAPSDDELEPLLSGEWLQEETQWDSLFVSRNPEGGWGIEILSPVTHAAAVFLGRFSYDCDEDALICLDGSLYEAPITDDETESGLGELISEHLQARIVFEAGESEDTVRLVAVTDMHESLPVTFVRADAFDGVSREEQPEL